MLKPGYIRCVYCGGVYRMKNVYFTDTGDYGEANNLVVFDTSKWTDDDWKQIVSAHLARRQSVAVSIGKKHL